MISSQSILFVLIAICFQGAVHPPAGAMEPSRKVPAAAVQDGAAESSAVDPVDANPAAATLEQSRQVSVTAAKVALTPQDTIPETAPADTIPETVPPGAERDTVPETAPQDTIPETAPPDTIPETAPNDTIPPFPRAPSPQDTLIAPPDTIPPFPDATLPQDTLPPPPDAPEEPEEIREVLPWPEMSKPGYEVVETDSTLRWFMALDWADRLHRAPGVITYRTGLLGQPSGLDIYSFETRHQNLVLNEMEVTDPVTGQINWNRLPIHKISTIQTNHHTYSYRSRANLREYYTVQPLTFLNFDEGGGDYRNLEFSFTHNFTPETNVELSFWDRRDGDQYPRNSLEGRQIIAKGRHNLSDQVMLKAGYFNNGLDLEQSFGYSVMNPAFYHFNPYNATAIEPGANSNYTTNDLYLQIFQRPDTGSPASRAAGIHYQTDAWNVDFSQDTSAYSLRDISAFAWQDFSRGESSLRARAEVYSKRDRSRRSLTTGSWYGWKASADGELVFFPGITASIRGSYEGRNDDKTGYETSAAIRLEPWNWFRVEGFGGAGSAIPDLQPLYWNAIEYQGNSLLANETAVHGGISSRIRFGPWLSLRMRADSRQVTDGIFLDAEGSFVNIDPYTNLSMSAALDLDSPLFEGSLSASSQEFMSNSVNPVNMQLDQSGQRLWLKGSFYWKNYVFNRAAYVKAGLSGLFSPGNYAPADYIVPLNRWQHGGASRALPDFHRVDVDVAARIRWFMLLLRYENVLDGVQQLGYFEADGYPMPGRRFIIGFRIVFTN